MADPVRREASDENVLAAPKHLIAEITDGHLSLQLRALGGFEAGSALISFDIGPPDAARAAGQGVGTC